MHGFIRVAGAVPKVGVCDVNANVEEIKALIKRATDMNASIVVFPELAVTGYTCGDIFNTKELRNQAMLGFGEVVAATMEQDITVIFGFPLNLSEGLINANAVVYHGEILGLVPSEDGSPWFRSVNLPEGISIFDQDVPMGTDLVFHLGDYTFAIAAGKAGDARAQLVFEISAREHVAGSLERERRRVREASVDHARMMISNGGSESTTDVLYSGQVVACNEGKVVLDDRNNSLESRLVMAEVDIDNDVLPYRDSRHVLCPMQVRNLRNLTMPIPVDPFVPEDVSERYIYLKEVFDIQTMGLAKRLKHTSCVPVVGVSGGLDSTLALMVAIKAAELAGLTKDQVIAVTMPGFGTSERSREAADGIMSVFGATRMEVDIKEICAMHLRDIGADHRNKNITYQNAQARERMQILMDIANERGGLVVGTSDLSEIALGFNTYGGDLVAMYNVNSSLPKGVVREVVRWCNANVFGRMQGVEDIINAPISPELMPVSEDGAPSQNTEDMIGKYEIHDFYLYYWWHKKFDVEKVLYMARNAFGVKYSEEELQQHMETFTQRFFANQFKRSCVADGAAATEVSLSPRVGISMPSDAVRVTNI